MSSAVRAFAVADSGDDYICDRRPMLILRGWAFPHLITSQINKIRENRCDLLEAIAGIGY
jgi:hypothetical protein